ncbi:MAG: pyruvate kinase, partial [Pygmaiobacter sp.]
RLLIDLRGPELRVGDLPVPARLDEGDAVTIGRGGIPMPLLIFPELREGQEILLDDGALLLRVDSTGAVNAACTVVRGGMLHARKSIALPGVNLHPPTLTDSDYKNLALAAGCGVTDVMLPFVRGAEDLITLRGALENCGAKNVRIFAKLENRQGVRVLPALLEYADQIVVARGDLGNDLPLWELPAVQKQIARVCRDAEKPFMVVTQLLHSMTHSAVPTRAEVLDIFNAVLDGASSLMLTGETAIGEYPIQAMRYLCRTAQEALNYRAAQNGSAENS